MDIGSGKPEPEQLQQVKHHLIDVVDPDYDFTAGEFCRRAGEAADQIKERSKIPLFVGGTGMYIESFFKGISPIPAVDSSFRELLVEEMADRGADCLYNELQSVDPVFASGVHRNDSQRIIRGLEVFRATGQAISSYYSNRKGAETEDTVYIGLDPPRDELRKKIDLRVDLMIERGFIDEVIELRKMGYTSELRSMRTIGYMELNELLDGYVGKAEAVEKIKTVTKQFAKRQMTWFRRNKKIHWFRPEDTKKITKKILNLLN